MAGIQSVSSIHKKPFLRADNTGYVALAGLCLTTVTSAVKNKTVKKCHKPLGYITAGLTLLHLGTILYSRYEWRQKQKEFIA